MEVDEEFLSALKAKEDLALNGGLRITKEGKTIDPSCCADFQDWREWELLQAGDIDSLWLGHDPSPWVEVMGDEVIIWSDEKEK
ncbi:MAG: hypothetical protein PHD01_18065 [Geobacteraceae bacterium]|nr:hypothetical protein [Geobacteraceae bacterium]